MDTESPPPVPDVTAIDSVTNGSHPHPLHLSHHLSHHSLKQQQQQLFQSYLHSQSSNSSSSITSNGGGGNSNSNNNNTNSTGSSNGNGSSSMRNNEVRTVMLHGVPIVALMMDNVERLCLAQISNTLLKNFSYNEIHNRRVALGITCVQCTPVQLELLRRAGAMPVSSRRCGMITKREAERLCKSFLSETIPPKLPDSFSFDVYHHCAWGCRGAFNPSRYNSSRAKCIKCCYCGLFFSPNKFIFHSHRLPDSKYVQPDAANFNSWRRHIKLSGSQPEEVLYAWEDVKAMFNGGSRKRAMAASLTSVSKQQQHRRQQNHQAQQAAHQQSQQQQQQHQHHQQQQSNGNCGTSGGRSSPAIAPALNFSSLPSQAKRLRLSPHSPEVGLTAIPLEKGSPTSGTMNANIVSGSGGVGIPISPVSGFGLSESSQQQQQASLNHHLNHHLNNLTTTTTSHHHVNQQQQQSQQQLSQPQRSSPPQNSSQLHLLNPTSHPHAHGHASLHSSHSSSSSSNSVAASVSASNSHLASVLANAPYPFPLISLASKAGLAGLTSGAGGARSNSPGALFTPPHPPGASGGINSSHFSSPVQGSGSTIQSSGNGVTGSPIHPSNLLASKSPGANSTSASTAASPAAAASVTNPDIRASFAEFLGQSWAWAAAAAAAGKSTSSGPSAPPPLISPYNYLFWPRPPIDSLRQVQQSSAQRAFASVTLPALTPSDLTPDHQVSPFFSPSSLMEKAVAAWEREMNSHRKSPFHGLPASVSTAVAAAAARGESDLPSDLRGEKRLDHLISSSNSVGGSNVSSSNSSQLHTSAFKPVSGIISSVKGGGLKSLSNVNVGGNSSSFRAENLMISDQISDTGSRSHFCNGSIDSASDQENSRSPLHPPSSRDELDDDEEDENEVDVIGESHGDGNSQVLCEESHLE